MPAKPKLSIGLPVRNGLPLLKETLDLLVKQSFAEFELIISDNASTDDTWAVCQRYAASDSRIRLLKNERNVGAADNANRVFRESKGDYFFWASADDLYLPDFAERCIDKLEDSPEAILCYPRWKVINVNGKEIPETPEPEHVNHVSPVQRFRSVVRGVHVDKIIFGVFRSKAIRQTGLFGYFPSSDRVLLAELMLLGGVCEVPEFLFHRRVHSRQQDYTNRRTYGSWFHPTGNKGKCCPYWRMVYEYAQVVRRSSLSLSDKLKCLSHLRHYVSRNRSWLMSEMILSPWRYLEMLYHRVRSTPYLIAQDDPLDEMGTNYSPETSDPYEIESQTFADPRLIDFHDRERWDGKVLRWSEPVAKVQFLVPASDYRIEIETGGLRGMNCDYEFSLAFNDTIIPRDSIIIDQGNIRFQVERSACNASQQTLHIECEPLVPADTGSIDYRHLGMPVFWIRLEPLVLSSAKAA